MRAIILNKLVNLLLLISLVQQINGDSDEDIWSGVVEEPTENGQKSDETVRYNSLLYSLCVYKS